MDRKDFRCLLSKLAGTTKRSGTAPGRLLRHVGRAMSLHNANSHFEAFEGRTMFEGSFTTAFAVAIDAGTGRGASVAGNGANFINPSVGSTDNDYFSFVAPSSDFVTILADTANESPASTLNTRVQVFNQNRVLVASGTNNGALSSGLASDGFTGFIATAGQTYFVVVSSDGMGPGVPGTYTLRVAAKSTLFDIGGEIPTELGVGREGGSPTPDFSVNPPVPITPILGQLGGTGAVAQRLRQDNIVYKFVVPAGTQWDNLVTVNVQSTQNNLIRRLDTRVDIYNAAGQLVKADSDAGRINDAFTVLRAHPGETYYIRVRSDEIRNANIELATGPFFLVLDAITAPIALNPVTRVGGANGALLGFGNPSIPPNPAMPRPTFQTDSYEFTAQGGGLTIITMAPAGLAPITDGALSLYDESGGLVAFNNDFAGANPRISAILEGGKRYFLIVDGFEINNGTQYALSIESNHTQSNIDDHVNTPDLLAQDPDPNFNDVRKQFELATALTWGPSTPLFDADGNIIRDQSLRTTARGQGRIEGPGDTDLFQFTPQVSMLQNYAGNNDDLGTSLFIGGSFDVGDPNNPWPTTSRDLTIWDAADYFYTGAQNFDPNFGVTYGFNDNADTVGTDRAEIYAMVDYDPGAPAAVPTGMSRRWLVVGGDFDLIVPSPFGPVTLKNLAVWFQDFNTGRWAWGSIGDVDGPVRALTSYLADETLESRDDPDTTIPSNRPIINGTAAAYLVVGGQFANVDGNAAANIATFDLLNGWLGIGGGTNGPVFALTTYDPADFGEARAASVGPPALPQVQDGRDIPNSLFIGGQFTSLDGVNARNLALWDGVQADDVFGGPVNIASTNAGPNGPVFALTTYVGWDPDGPTQDPLPVITGPPPTGQIEAPARVLVVGGQFTSINNGNGQTIPAANLAAWGFLAASAGASRLPDRPDYNPRGGWQQVGTGVTGANDNGDPIAVLALTEWDPPDINNDDQNFEPILVIGGAFNVGGMQNLTGFAVDTDGDLPQALGFGWFSDSEGTDGIVRALTTLTDLQEPGIATDLNSGVPQEVLYVGGDFGQVSNGPLAPPVIATRIAQYSAFHDPLSGQDFFTFTRLNSGVDNDDPTAVPAAAVFALSGFDDGNPLEWDRHDRRQERLSIQVAASDGAQFFNARVRVYDSNFNIVYGFGRPGSETISPIFPDPAGMVDHSIAPNGNLALEGITLWAGETYYIEISDASNTSDDQPIAARGSGRYTFLVTAAAMPDDLNNDGVLDDVNAQVLDEPDEGEFTDAFNFNIQTQLATGDATNLRNSATNPGQPPLNGNNRRTQHISPFRNDVPIEGFDLGNIHDADDTDLYTFRAEFTGTAEIRLDTTFLADQHGQALAGDLNGTFAGLARTLTSHLDGALRVFRNDFVQIAYNDDNYAVGGEFSVTAGTDSFPPDPLTDFTSGLTSVGTITNAIFFRRDPRIVIPVVAGNFYFIQVESGQKWKDGSPADPADRIANIAQETEIRNLNGAYRLIVNQMPNQLAEIINGERVLDDHSANATTSTVIDIGQDPLDPANNGRGSLTGRIRNTPGNPTDLDVFNFIAPGSGDVRVTVRPTGAGNTLLPALALFGYSNGALQPATPIATGAPLQGGGVFVTVPAIAGQAFQIRVNGGGNSQGTYIVEVSGVPAVDDHADLHKFADATVINLFDFQGSGSASGRLEAPGDSDAFKFRVSDFSNVTINVSRASATADASLNAEVTIYEVSEDPVGNPILLRIALSTAVAGPLGTASVTFPVSPARRIVDDQGVVLRDYPFYYLVVKDLDPTAGFGSYNINFDFPPTDDHADGDTDGDGVFDTGEFNLATRIVLDSSTGQGNETGIIEVTTDSDLFLFTAPAGGNASVIISRPTSSLIRTRVTILDASGVIIASEVAADDPINGTAIVNFSVVRNTNYFIVVDGYQDPGTPNSSTTLIGGYTVSVVAPPVDDYPNAGEFTLANAASNIVLASGSGIGRVGGTAGNDPSNPRLSPSGDTDLFTFTTLRVGNVTITVNPFDTAVGRIAPSLQLFDSNGNLLQSTTGGRLATISLTIANAPAGTRYYILVGAVAGVPQTTTTGEYSVTVAGPAGTPGTGPTPDAIDFTAPTDIVLNVRNGDGSASDAINVINDRDLFRFRTTAAGPVFVQLVAGNGSLLRASIRVLNAANELVTSQVAFDSDGISGAIANVAFLGEANTFYYIVVDGLGDSTGAYTVKVNTQPLVNELVYPEGYASVNVREFVSIVNPNDYDVTYTIYLRYETGSAETVVATSVIRANSRNGLTIIDPSYRTPGLRLDTPYAIVINSSGPLGATIAHYDFGNSIGESFTETTSGTWDFARVEKNPESVRDYVVFYNPNSFDVAATLTAYVNGQAFSETLIFGALRRGGFSINDIAGFPSGIYSATLTVVPVNPINQSAYIGVVASLSHYNITEGTAFGLLGDGEGGSTAGVITNISQGEGISSAATFFNPGNTPATVTLVGTYIRTTLPTFSRTFQVAARSTVRFTGESLGLSPNQPLGITYSSNVPIVASSDQLQNGDADGTTASTTAGSEFFFGDGYVDSRFPGLQEEYLYIYNPGAVGLSVAIKLNFLDGTSSTFAVTVNSRGFAEVRLDTRPELVSSTGPTFYAIDVFAAQPIVVNMQHYDLALAGGWTAMGVPFGILSDLNKIT